MPVNRIVAYLPPDGPLDRPPRGEPPTAARVGLGLRAIRPGPAITLIVALVACGVLASAIGVLPLLLAAAMVPWVVASTVLLGNLPSMIAAMIHETGRWVRAAAVAAWRRALERRYGPISTAPDLWDGWIDGLR